MNPKWGLSTIPEPDKKVKSTDLVNVIKSIKQQEQIDLYNASKKDNQKF